LDRGFFESRRVHTVSISIGFAGNPEPSPGADDEIALAVLIPIETGSGVVRGALAMAGKAGPGATLS